MMEQARQLNKLMEFFKLARLDPGKPARKETTPAPPAEGQSQWLNQPENVRGFPGQAAAKAPATAKPRPSAPAERRKTGTDDWDSF